jgi:hypothetical protein
VEVINGLDPEDVAIATAVVSRIVERLDTLVSDSTAALQAASA